MIVADISNLFFANLAFHIQEYAEKLGYTAIIANTNESDAKMKKMINILNSRQVDGLIIVPTEKGEEDIQDLVNSKFPFVLIDRWFPNTQASHVVIDNYDASKNAVQYLIDKDCKRVGLFRYNTSLPHMEERKRSYADALLSAGLYNEALIKGVSYENIKEDVAVICFDKSDAFDFASVKIPYLLQPIPDMGRKSVDILLEQINSKDVNPVKGYKM